MKRNSPVTQLPSIIEESDNDLEEEIQIDGPTGYGGCLCKDCVGEKEWFVAITMTQPLVYSLSFLVVVRYIVY